MVKLTEVEDEHFQQKPTATKDDALLVSDDDDDDYTDTGNYIPAQLQFRLPLRSSPDKLLHYALQLCYIANQFTQFAASY